MLSVYALLVMTGGVCPSVNKRQINLEFVRNYVKQY